MFTGLVEAMGVVERVTAEPPGVRLAVRQPEVLGEARVGESIAINGCCLTVVAARQGTAEFEAGAETLARTNLGRLQGGAHVNLERSLKVGDRLGGHFVTGHIDSLGWLDRRETEGDWATYWFRVPPPLTRHMAGKGSIAVDGVSLTLVAVERERFSVALIPHTLQVTTLGRLREGDAVNLETDILAKYVEQQVRWFADGGAETKLQIAN
jgi:riboflavin synthase